MRKVREGLGGAVIDIEGDDGFEGFSLQETLQILDGEGGGVLASVFGGTGDVGEEGDVGQAAEGGVVGEGFGFVDIEADLKVGDAVTGDTDEGGFVDDGASAEVDEDAAGADGAEKFFGDDVVILFGVGGEFDDDVVLGEEVFEGGGAGDTEFLKDGVRHTGGKGGDGDTKRAEERDHFLGDGAKAVEADASAKEALGDGFHAVFPATVAVHGDIPVARAAHSGEDEEKATFRNGATDGVAPVGDEEAVFDEFAGYELFDATGEVGDVTELAGMTDGEIGGQGGATPSAKESFGLVFLEERRPGGGLG